ncbi:micronuclear linker histone polyprotein [Drosophila kikkawai]|uniref:Micronuclear linker histone polyprotein n=1 Tax=Drosophila kikkawai TaxID=30033 RepID=A0ABM3C7M7_DROKI|nr:uncharacterized protein LOC108072871 [Drosophila kikkawai]
MNALKKNSVLNQQCLRNKIEELSPLLLKQFNLGVSNKDKLFQATWSYYASGCQERLTSIRRRIEQNARIVAPTVGPRTQLHKNLNISLYESSLPPGVNLEDHIYNELVSCFRCSDEDPAKAKVRKEPNSVQPEQWNSWKCEELEVRQMLKQTKNPYLQEELKKKLQKLIKLTNRHLTIKLQSQCEETKKTALKKTKGRRPAKHTSSQGSKSSLVNPEREHSNIESIFNNPKYPYISKRYTNPKLSNNEKPKKLKSSFTNKLPKMSEESKFKGDKTSAQVKNKKDSNKNRKSILKSKSQKSLESEVRENKTDGIVKIKDRRNEEQNIDKITDRLKDSIKLNRKNANVENISKPSLQTSSSEANAWQLLTPALSSFSFKDKSDSTKSITRGTFIKDKYQFKRKSSISGRNRMGSIRKSNSWHFHYPSKPNREGVKPPTRDTNITASLSENSRRGSIRKSYSWHSLDSADRDRRNSSTRRSYQKRAITKSHSRHSETYIPFKAHKPKSKPSTKGKNIRSSLTESSPMASIKKAKSKSIENYDWPPPMGVSHMEYFKSFGHTKTKDHKEKEMSVFPKIAFREEPKPIITEPLDEENPSGVGTPSLESASHRNMISDRISFSYGRTPSSVISNEEIKLPQPLIIADVIMDCLQEYGSEISFKDPFTNFMKPNKLDRCYPEKTIKKPQPKKVRRVKAKEIKPKKNTVCKKIQTKPLKCETPTCSLCHMVRRRQSELPPYMKEMQRERQRLELKAYYNQMIRKDNCQGRCQKPDNPKFSRACAREALTRCYESLKLCQEVLEQRLLKSSKECQAGRLGI